MEIQTRSEESGLNFFPTLKEAMEAALKDLSIWKISFSLPNGERVRMVLHSHEDLGIYEWVYEPLEIPDVHL